MGSWMPQSSRDKWSCTRSVSAFGHQLEPMGPRSPAQQPEPGRVGAKTQMLPETSCCLGAVLPWVAVPGWLHVPHAPLLALLRQPWGESTAHCPPTVTAARHCIWGAWEMSSGRIRAVLGIWAGGGVGTCGVFPSA